MLKLPNGFGTVYKLSGGNRRRRPYVVKKTINGKQKAIGYFADYGDALQFLLDYNKKLNITLTSQYIPDLNPITFEEMYNRWKEKHFDELKSDSARASYKNSFKHCQKLHKRNFKDLRLPDLDEVISDIREKLKATGGGQGTQKKVKSLMYQLYTYTIKYSYNF